jgi:hypothetical protein
MLLEAVPAVHRAPLSWLERHFAVLAAVRAFRLMHLSGAAEAPSPSVSPVSKLHVLTLYFSTSPSRTMFASAAPFRERRCPNHLPRWSVCRCIIFLLSKFITYYLFIRMAAKYCHVILSQWDPSIFLPGPRNRAVHWH